MISDILLGAAIPVAVAVVVLAIMGIGLEDLRILDFF